MRLQHLRRRPRTPMWAVKSGQLLHDVAEEAGVVAMDHNMAVPDDDGRERHSEHTGHECTRMHTSIVHICL